MSASLMVEMCRACGVLLRQRALSAAAAEVDDCVCSAAALLFLLLLLLQRWCSSLVLC
jgi:hypothetical protein